MKTFITKTIAALVLFFSGSVFALGYFMVKGASFSGKHQSGRV